jgi:CRP/FNR family transcriptional regulator
VHELNELKRVSCFENLQERELAFLSSFSHKRNFKKGEILFYEKETPKYLTLLTAGKLKIYKTDTKNNEVVLHNFNTITFIAEMAVFAGIKYPASAVFETEGSVIEINFKQFKNNFLINPDVSFAFFLSLSKKIQNLEDVISLNIVLDSTSRVAKYICENNNALQGKNSDIAKYLHMTPETLSRILKKFIKLGFLEKGSSGYTVTSEEGLKILYES